LNGADCIKPLLVVGAVDQRAIDDGPEATAAKRTP
jgi:hypothetical protein